jgi:hypothetical protein
MRKTDAIPSGLCSAGISRLISALQNAAQQFFGPPQHGSLRPISGLTWTWERARKVVRD